MKGRNGTTFREWNYLFGTYVGMNYALYLGGMVGLWRNTITVVGEIDYDFLWRVIFGMVISGIANHPPIFAKCKYLIGLGVAFLYGWFLMPFFVFSGVFGLESISGVASLDPWRWIFWPIFAICMILGGVYHLPIIPAKVKGAITGAAAGPMIPILYMIFIIPVAILGASFFDWSPTALYSWIPDSRRGYLTVVLLLMALGAWMGANYHEHDEETEQAREAG